MRLSYLSALALLAVGRVAGAGDVADLVRAEFKAQLEHVADPRQAADSPALKAYSLYPYLEAARLRVELSRVPDAQRLAPLEHRVRDFLAAHGDEPVTRPLRKDLLEYFGERMVWTDLQLAAPAEVSDLSLRCYLLDARLSQNRLDHLRDEVVELWLNQRDNPPACARVFAWIDSPARLSDAEIEARARFAATNHVPLPKALDGLLPPRRALMKYADELLGNPLKGLQRYVSGELPKDVPAADWTLGDILLEAFDTLARRDSRDAKELYEKLVKKGPFVDEQKGLLLRAHALGLAYDADPEGVSAFRDVPDAALDSLAREWRVRVALRHGDWKWALRWLEAMPEPQKGEPRWKYWRARMLERRHREQAMALYAEVAKEREYYAFLAAERLGRKPDLRPQPLVEDPAILGALDALPTMQRAHELLRCELPALAASELRYALRERPAAEKVQAARLVAGWGWFEPAVRLLSETAQWDDLMLRFPLPYDAQIDPAAKATALPPEWLYSVLRTESLYDPRAVSRSGAVGLLQLMLPTARKVALKAGLPQPQREDLFKPEVNIALGARYLRELQEQFGQRFVLTLAAYNAGPQKLPEWLPEKPVEGDIWVENIPYNETRQYVQRALSSLVILSWRRTGESVRLAPLLQPIGPLNKVASR